MKRIKNDVSGKFQNAIEAFECDFTIANKKNSNESNLVLNLPMSEKLKKDIDLLEELSFGLRYGKLKIVEVEEEQNE